MKSFISKQLVILESDHLLLKELKMAPNTLVKQVLNNPEILVGVEYEMIVDPGLGDLADSNDISAEPDYDQDERLVDIDDAINFFNYDGRLDVRDAVVDYVTGMKSWEKFRERYLYNAAQEELDSFKRRLSPEELEDFDDDEFIRELIDAAEPWTRSMINDFMSEEYITALDLYNEGGLYWPPDRYTKAGLVSFDEAAKNIASELSEVLGVHVESSATYHGGSSLGARDTYWFESDSSLDHESFEFPGELVSPPQTFSQTISDMKKIMAWARQHARTEKSTGLHINVSVPNFQNIDWFKVILFLGDQYVLDMFNRRSNNYASSSYQKILDRFRYEESPGQFDPSLLDAGDLSKIAKDVFTSKYQSVHLRTGWVEFRGPGGDWLNTDITTLMGTIARFAGVLMVGSDPSAYRNEYAKKAYDFFSRVSALKNSPDDNALGMKKNFIASLRNKLTNVFSKLNLNTYNKQQKFKKEFIPIYQQIQSEIHNLEGKKYDRTQVASLMKKIRDFENRVVSEF